MDPSRSLSHPSRGLSLWGCFRSAPSRNGIEWQHTSSVFILYHCIAGWIQKCDFTFRTDARCHFIIHCSHQLPTKLRNRFADVSFLLWRSADDDELHSTERFTATIDNHRASAGSCCSWTSWCRWNGRHVDFGKNTFALHVLVLLPRFSNTQRPTLMTTAEGTDCTTHNTIHSASFPQPVGD